jgi:hypothetical protein
MADETTENTTPTITPEMRAEMALIGDATIKACALFNELKLTTRQGLSVIALLLRSSLMNIPDLATNEEAKLTMCDMIKRVIMEPVNSEEAAMYTAANESGKP